MTRSAGMVSSPAVRLLPVPASGSAADDGQHPHRERRFRTDEYAVDDCEPHIDVVGPQNQRGDLADRNARDADIVAAGIDPASDSSAE